MDPTLPHPELPLSVLVSSERMAYLYHQWYLQDTEKLCHSLLQLAKHTCIQKTAYQVPLKIFSGCNVSPFITCISNKYMSHYLFMVHSYHFLANGLLTCMTAQHTQYTATVLVTGYGGINSAQSSPLVILLVLTQCDCMVAILYGNFWVCITVMTISKGYGHSTFLFCTFLLFASTVVPAPYKRVIK